MKASQPAHGRAPLPDRPLPLGWRWVKLGQIGSFASGGTPPKNNSTFWDGSIPFVTGADVTELYVSSRHARSFLTSAGLYSGKTAVCYPGTILIVSRTRVGRVGLAIEVMGASQDLSPFVCGSGVYPEFIARYIQSITSHLHSNLRGSTVQGLTREFIHDLPIPLPPLAEQKRIVAILNEQMAAVEKARGALQEQLNEINVLPSALLRRAFNGEL